MRAHSVLLLLLLTKAAFAAEPAAGLNLAAGRAELEAQLAAPRFSHAEWGLKVVSVRSGVTVFERNAEKLLKPASIAKLFTAAAALDLLGPDYTIKTSLYAAKKPQNGVLGSDLVVYGRGDPTFCAAFEPATNIFRRIVEAVRAAGVSRIEGDLFADATFFQGPRFGTGWTWDDVQYYYGPEVTALAVEENTLDLRIRAGESVGAACQISSRGGPGSLSILNRTKTLPPRSRSTIDILKAPGANRVIVSGGVPLSESVAESVAISDAVIWFAERLKQDLERAGISVAGSARAVAPPEALRSNPSSWVEIGSTKSAPLRVIVDKMLTVSQNLYAQLLLLQLGANDTPSAALASSEELGLKRLLEFARRAGVPAGELELDDGTGLSRSGLVTPNAFTQLLRTMRNHPTFGAFRAGLPEPGEEGTLRTRLKDLKGRLWAKTGTIRFVNTLAGYVVTNAGEELAFAIMLNAYSQAGTSKGAEEVDALARILARISEQTGKE